MEPKTLGWLLSAAKQLNEYVVSRQRDRNITATALAEELDRLCDLGDELILLLESSTAPKLADGSYGQLADNSAHYGARTLYERLEPVYELSASIDLRWQTIVKSSSAASLAIDRWEQLFNDRYTQAAGRETLIAAMFSDGLLLEEGHNSHAIQEYRNKLRRVRDLAVQLRLER